mgnify:CR=1 FL=1
MTFDATVNPVVYEGGVPVFIDTEYIFLKSMGRREYTKIKTLSSI